MNLIKVNEYIPEDYGFINDDGMSSQTECRRELHLDCTVEIGDEQYDLILKAEQFMTATITGATHVHPAEVDEHEHAPEIIEYTFYQDGEQVRIGAMDGIALVGRYVVTMKDMIKLFKTIKC